MPEEGYVNLGRAFTWPFSAVAGIRYGNLTPEQLAHLSPFMQQHLPNRASISHLTSLIANAGVPELEFSDPVLPAATQNTEDRPSFVVEPMRYGSFSNVSLNVGLADQLVLNIPSGDSMRTFLMIVNSHPTQNMFLTFQVAATALMGIPILFNFGFIILDTVCPQDDVHLIANGAATTGMLLYANRNPNQRSN